MNSVFNILDYGAVADSITNNAKAIQQAIDEASVNGGQVFVPAGTFLSGTIRLKSNIDFHLSAGAVLLCSCDETEILSFRELYGPEEQVWAGGCFILAYHENNITISGEGIIQGQGKQLTIDDHADGDFNECPLNIAPFRPRTTFLEDITDLKIKDITIRDAASWSLHMAGCRRVMVHNIKILNNLRGANNDGIDPDCCKDVMISDCLVETGDDAIVVKTTELMKKKYGTSENIVVSNCVLTSRDSGVKIGTETHGDIRNITISNCIMKNCSRGIGIWARDGGNISDIYIHHITGNVLKYADAIYRTKGPARWWGVGEPVFISATYRNEEKKFPGTIKNIMIDSMNIKAESSIFVGGEEESIIEDISLTNMNITLFSQGTQKCGYFDELPSIRKVYPHSIPVIYGRFVDGLQVTGKVRYCQPYTPADNALSQTEQCKNVEILMKCQEK